MKLLLTILILLTGCAVKLPQRGRVAPDYPEQWQVAGTEANTPMPSWWRQFDDAALNDLVSEALRQNHNLQAAAARLEQARLRAAIAGAFSLPDTVRPLTVMAVGHLGDLDAAEEAVRERETAPRIRRPLPETVLVDA